MRLPRQDNGKPIKVGDPGFLYKGVFHSIQWVGEDPYRVRGEVLVIRDDKVFLRYYKDNTMDRCYRLPGGSIDLDSTPMEQAKNEVNEEALIDVHGMTDTNIQYDFMYPEGTILKGGDICIAYKGCITRVYIASFLCKVNKQRIDEHDLDDDMAKHGKFYPISKVAKILTREHIEALLGSSLVSDDNKSILRNLIVAPNDNEVELNVNKLFYLNAHDLSPTLFVRPTVDTYNNTLTQMGIGDMKTKRVSLYKSIKSAVLCTNLPANSSVLKLYIPNYLDVNYLCAAPDDHKLKTGIKDEFWYTHPISFKRVGTVEYSAITDTLKVNWDSDELKSLLENIVVVTEAEDDPEEDDDLEDYGEDIDDAEETEEDEGDEDTPEQDDDTSEYEELPDEDDDISDYEDDEADDYEDEDGEDSDVPNVEDGDTMDYEDGDSGDDGVDTDSEDGEDSEDEIDNEDEESNENSNVKNYNLMKDYSRVFYLVTDILNKLDGTIYPLPVQNSVLAQINKNMMAVKDLVTQYIKYKFSTSSYASNLYQYTIIIQAIKINLEMLNKIQHLDTDSKQTYKK